MGPAIGQQLARLGILLWLLSVLIVAAQGNLSITGRVLEESEAGKAVMDVRQELADLQRLQNASMSARQVAELLIMGDNNLFYINNGLLLVKRRIDYESLCGAERAISQIKRVGDSCLLHLRLLVTYEQSQAADDNADNSFDTVDVFVQVRDLNDHAPTFENDPADAGFRLSVLEHVARGTKVRLPLATDPDAGPNGALTYSVQLLGNKSEQIEQFFSVQNEPHHKQADLIVLTDLDRETRASYLLNLTVCDHGSPSKRCVWRKLTVLVADVNDHAPIIVNASAYVLDVREDASVPLELTRIIALDKDDRDGHFGQLQFKIDPARSTAAATQHFVIDPSTGVVQLIAPLDREKLQRHKIAVNVFDSPKSPQSSRSASCFVIVNVIDVNDQAPVIEVTKMNEPEEFDDFYPTNAYSLQDSTGGLQTLSVFENRAADTVIALLHVSDADADANGQVECRVEEERNFKLLQTSISPAAYLLMTRQPFDFEQQRAYMVHIECTDKGEQSKRTVEPIQVRVVDRNDNPPRFSSGFNASATAHYMRVTVPENNQPNASLLRLEIADNDTNKVNLRHAVQLLSHQDLFYVTNGSSPHTVTLHAFSSLDREKTSLYNLTLVMSDNTCECSRNVSTLHLTLQLADVNDNVPVLITKNVTVNQFANVSGVPLTTLIATDADAGHNAQLHFSLVSTEFNMPKLHVTADGRVFLLEGQLDRKTASQYCMLVNVHDGGQPPLDSTSRVCLLADANDNQHAPTWRFPSHSDTINVTLPRAAIDVDLEPIEIARLDAYDADEQVASNLQYTLRSSSQQAYVELDGARLLLRRVSTLADDQLITLSLLLQVTDGGKPSRSSSSALRVNIWLDETHNIFTQSRAHNGTTLQSQSQSQSQSLVWMVLVAILVSVVLVAIVAGLLVHCFLTRRRAHPRKTAGASVSVSVNSRPTSCREKAPPVRLHEHAFAVPRLDASASVVCRVESGDESDYSCAARKHASLNTFRATNSRSSYYECDCNSYNSRLQSASAYVPLHLTEHERPPRSRPTEADSLLSSHNQEQEQEPADRTQEAANNGESESTLGSNQLHLADLPSDNNESGISVWESRTRCPRMPHFATLPASPDDVTVVFNDPTFTVDSAIGEQHADRASRAKLKRKKRAKMLAVSATSRIVASRKSSSSASGTLDSATLTASACASMSLRAAPLRFNTSCSPLNPRCSLPCGTSSPQTPSTYCSKAQHAVKNDPRQYAQRCCQPVSPSNLSTLSRHSAIVQLQQHRKQLSPVSMPSGDMIALMSRQPFASQHASASPDKSDATLDMSTAEFAHKNYLNTASLATSLI